MKELDDEDEVVETGIEEVMEGSAVENWMKLTVVGRRRRSGRVRGRLRS